MAETWKRRLELASLGWINSFELTRHTDTWFFTSRVSRWDWHQHRCDQVQFHKMERLEPEHLDLAILKMKSCLTYSSELALKAWMEFPVSIPRQNSEDNWKEVPLEVEPIGTRIIFAPHSVTNCNPTEYIALDDMCDENEEQILFSILEFAKNDIDYCDRFSHHGRNTNNRDRYRRWGLDYTLTPKTWNGERLPYSPCRFSLESNLESMVGASLVGSLSAINYLKQKYNPDGSLGNKPPLAYRSNSLDKINQTITKEEEKYLNKM